ncbi:hypothetical protein BDB00DRAFT_873149 [Zychaea mexicana]|uniref:uncharacterized protein n=1 Tax=Zychaea mexicana TaxID=64656 RepID=UPI0022FEEAFF|nr:uncharacterized protein BDB00DRAFT_873149 [Zychaea mexicana]KAI9492753.1 hypothetical protein BDB00DRAFT_873149 [Zychaea mexicana]
MAPRSKRQKATSNKTRQSGSFTKSDSSIENRLQDVATNEVTFIDEQEDWELLGLTRGDLYRINTAVIPSPGTDSNTLERTRVDGADDYLNDHRYHGNSRTTNWRKRKENEKATSNMPDQEVTDQQKLQLAYDKLKTETNPDISSTSEFNMRLAFETARLNSVKFYLQFRI